MTKRDGKIEGKVILQQHSLGHKMSMKSIRETFRSDNVHSRKLMRFPRFTHLTYDAAKATSHYLQITQSLTALWQH